jgi:tetratricopeptide (TPR) repeat protein
MDPDEMLTPAQKYKRALTSLSGEERAIMRLEHRWNKNIPKWTKATTYIQKIIRGFIARDRVSIMKEGIRIENLKQKCVAVALESLRSKKYNQAIIDTEEALKLDPNSFEAYKIRGHARLALALEIKHKNRTLTKKDKIGEKKAYIAAIDEYSQALKLNEMLIQVR